ncbi:ead/Ea22-like family protein [Salmonella enterica subsp. enterica serovar Stanley]|nr:ead/Ea22-like family protein [Salmonella enterica]EGX2061831.1 ead/Ea22-like family protein [Salmonella enterica subsp. enterica serovar Stanley]EGX5312532.1 ead/Ea22-like family protein [Salmonella enterica subsp. enterica serovar Stanley]EKS2202424.1 ead/Ea22-like family protein [Salmonella enterica]
MGEINYQALRIAAENATPGEWCTDDYGVIADAGLNANYYIASCSGPDNRANKRFIAAANPATVLALLDELDSANGYASAYEAEKWHYHGLAESEGERADRAEKRVAELESIATDYGVKFQKAQDALKHQALLHKSQMEAAEKRIAELSKAVSVNNHWKPDVCPITGRKFFMWIEHEKLGYVPTYGGPFDSYTIPTRDSSDEYSCERYDHDVGGWVEGEFIGLYLIDDDEQCRVCELEERIAELEARVVNLPKRSVGEVMHMSGFSRDYAEGWCAGNDNAIHEIRAAGIKVKES